MRLDLELKAIRRRVRSLGKSTAESVWLLPSLKRSAPYTMLRPGTLLGVGQILVQVLHRKTPGAVVECGVWRGGCSFFMADVLRRSNDTRLVWMFDSFEGMPQAEEIDGRAALEWQKSGDAAINDAVASIEEVEATRERLNLPNARIVKGWFDESIPPRREEIGAIAVLRLDCDWHRSVTTCLDLLYDQVSPGGWVLVDDYYTFDGCALAIHEFLGKRGLSHRLKTQPGHTIAFRKV